ncbi:glutathione-disulfide reductase [Acidithiobacillus sp. IBUN Pt1247-S3]|uniref:glutathione-disulfide reductase n=1 Tax=Acidithiobacillus sp. IBUN Pt1247-S3 TaxID=3166642 RepID=UPI0034E3F27C
MSIKPSFDLIVIGGGSGGIATANRAASYGARVALVAEGPLGGTCVNVGCVPKKLFWNAAHLATSHELTHGYGLTGEAWQFDWAQFKERRDAYIQRLNSRYAEGLNNNKVELFRGHGRLQGKDQVSVDNTTLLKAPKILLATGGTPIWPEIPGAELGIDSDGFFALEQQPRRVAVVGAGYIAVELAGVFRALGSDVSLIMRRNHFLNGFEPMLREHLMEIMQVQGINLLAQRQVTQLRREDRGFCLDFVQGDCLGGLDAVVWAIGRRPLTQDLGLAEAGLQVDSDGYIAVDPYQNTAVDGIYAVGDITRAPALTPVAIAAGRRLADRIFGGQSERHLDSSLTPTVIFSHPPIATVGMSEIEARERYGDEQIKCYQPRFVPLLRAFATEPERTAMKLVTVGHDERIVGLHAIGDGVDEMLQGFAVAIRMGARKQDFDDTIAIHPTSSEEFVTMR